MRKSVLYFTGFAIFMAAGICLQAFYTQAELYKLLSVQHSFLLNVFFINYTFLGDGIFAFCLTAILIFYFKRKKQGLLLLTAVVAAALTVQLIKNIIAWPQMQLFFEPGRYNYLDNTAAIPNFPSGHTAIAFAIAAIIVLTEKKRRLQLPVLCAAILVAYSRIYLAPQLTEDVIAGAATGTAAATFIYCLYKVKKLLPQFKKALHKKTYTATNDAALQPG